MRGDFFAVAIEALWCNACWTATYSLYLRPIGDCGEQQLQDDTVKFTIIDSAVLFGSFSRGSNW
jgi:hypothetical protein